MPKVSTHHLSPDGARADSAFGDHLLGELNAEQLGALLGHFRTVDPVANHEHEPAVVLQSTAGKFRIRTGAGKLHLYDARDSSQPAVEFDVPGLVAAFTSVPAARVVEEEPLVDLPAPKPLPRILGTLALITGLGFNAWAAYTLFQSDASDPAPVVEPVPAAEIARQRLLLAGAYVSGTGHNDGDRLILLGPDDTVRLQDLAADRSVRHEVVTTGEIGRHHGRLCLVLPGPAGLIEVLPDGQLLYCGDHYQHLARK